MNATNKTKEQLIEDLRDLGRRVIKLEALEAEYKNTKKDLVLFKSIIELSQEAIAVSDPDGRIVYINPAHEKLFGRGLEEARGTNYRDYYPQESIDVLNRQVVPALSGGKSWQGVLDAADANGRRFPLWERADTVRDADGRMIYAFGLMHDISKEMLAKKRLQKARDEMEVQIAEHTSDLESVNRQPREEIEERKQMAKALVDSEERYRHLIELSPDGIFIHCEKKIVYVNRAGTELLGARDPEQLIGKPIINFVHPDYRKIVEGRMQKVLHEKSKVPLLEEKIVNLNGVVIDVEVAAILSTYQDKPAIQLIVHDITERKRAEDKLRKSEKLYRMLVETMNDSLGIIDEEGIVTYVNDRLCSLLGYSRQELFDRPLTDFLDPANQDLMNKQINARRKGKHKSYEITWIRKDGVKVPTIISPQPIYDSTGSFKGSFGVITDISEIKLSEEKLIKSEASLADAQRIAHLGNWKWDIANNEVFWSDEIYRIFGLVPHEFDPTYESILDCVHPEDRERVDRAVNDALNGEKRFSFDHRIVLPDGSECIIHTVGEVSIDKNEKPVQMIGTAQDITENKRIIGALETHVKQQAVIAEMGRHALSSQDMNELMNKVVGLVSDCLDVDYCKILELLPNGDSLLLRAGVGWKEGLVGHATVGTDTSSQAGYTLLSNKPIIVEDLPTETRFSGPELLVEHNVISGMSVIIHGKNRSFGILGVHTTKPRIFTEDEVSFFQSVANMLAVVMNRKLAENQLRKSRALLHSVFEGISEPLIMMDRDLTIQMLNKAAREHFQITRDEELLGKCCFKVIKERTEPCDGCSIPSAVLSGEPKTFEQKDFWRSDPEKVYQVAIYPLLKEMNTKPGSIIRISDITELRQREKQLMLNDKLTALGLLASGIAHEVNNPNSFIAFNIPILREYLNEMIPIVDEYAVEHENFAVSKMPYAEFREDIFKLLDNMDHGSQRINEIISGLRKFVKSDPRSEKREVNLKKVIERVLTFCRGKIKKRVKLFEVNIPEEIYSIYTNPDAVEQILTNLLINATHAMDKEDSWMNLSMRYGNTWRDHIIIECSDNGCGMDAETQKKIFDPFVTSKAPEGSGLGLYVCHNLVEGLDGRIEVESVPGKGSMFRVTLPDEERRKKERQMSV